MYLELDRMQVLSDNAPHPPVFPKDYGFCFENQMIS